MGPRFDIGACVLKANSYFKDLSHWVKSFKNIAKTLETHHQYLVTYYLNSGSAAGKSPFCKETEVGVGTHYM